MTPYHSIFKREDGVSDNCVSCSDTMPACNCVASQTCQQITRTCRKCAYIRCIDKPGGGSSKNIGGIAGGVVGSFVFIALVIIYLVRMRRKQHKSNRYLRMEAQDKELLEVLDGDYKDEENGQDPIKLSNLAPEFDTESLKSTGEQSMAPTFKSSKFSGKSRRNTSYRNSGSTFQSMATSAISRASNIIPIAYIPGVKVKSNSTLINNRQILDDVQSLDSRKNATTYGSPLSTMTAVRAVPKLVDMGRKGSVKSKLSQVQSTTISEESSDDETEVSSYTSTEGYKKNNPTLRSLSEREKLSKKRKSASGMTHIIEENDDDSELISLGSDSDDEELVRNNIRGNTPQLPQFIKNNKKRPSYGIGDSDSEEDMNPVNPFEDKFDH